MTTKQRKSRNSTVKRTTEKHPTLRAEKERLERELKELRDENRVLKRNLAALVFKDDPINLDLKPEDGIAEPSLIELVAALRRSGK